MFYRLAATLLLLAGTASAVQLPLKFSFQGKLLNPATNNPRNETVTMEFRILDRATAGTLLWGPESRSVSVSNGVFSTTVGETLALSPELFAGASAYLSVTVLPDSYASGEELMPRQQLVMSPYAFTAAQLSSDGDIRINPRVAYSTFTTGGNLLVAHGVSAATGSFTATGSAQYSVTTSSGISMTAGTLKLASGSGGLDAQGAPIRAENAVILGSATARQFFGIGASSAAYKPADETIANSATLQDDDHLALPIAANETWTYTGMLEGSSASATPDLKIAFTVPTSAVFRMGYQCMYGNLAAGNANVLSVSGTASVLLPIAAATPMVCLFSGSVSNSTNAGFVQLQWAQNASNANGVTLKAQSYMRGVRVK